MISAAQKIILSAINAQGRAYARQITHETGLTEYHVLDNFMRLYWRGLIKKCNPPKDTKSGGSPRQYVRLTKAGKDALAKD